MRIHTEFELAVDAIDRLFPDSRAGLPDKLFYLTSRLTPLVNVDLLIVNEYNQKLLTWRADQFYGPGWHLPGGIIRFKESMEQRIAQVAHGELGVRVRADAHPLTVVELMNTDRDIRGHFISILFRCRLVDVLSQTTHAMRDDHAESGQWRWFDKAPSNLIKPHIRFVDVINSTVY